MNIPEYRDDDLCADCGGKCCMIYVPSRNMKRQRLHEDEKHLYGGGHYLEYGVEPLSEKIHPHACDYLGMNGCIIPWERRPSICKSFRCGIWRDLIYRR
ncbi:MAG: hypothetical protein ABSC17_07310 [Thermacetogeniaceae bacterium]